MVSSSSSAGVTPSQTCSQYRSIWSVFRRRSDPSSAACRCRAPAPPACAPVPVEKPAFVAITIRSLSPRSATNRPTISSLSPPE